MTIGGWLILAAFLAGLVALLVWKPWSLALTSILFVVMAMSEAERRRRLRRLAASRPGESICTFARSFDCRVIDTRIIRATHEELQGYYAGLCPIRASDRFLGVAGIDEEELDEIASDIANRTGRSLDHCEENPFVGRIDTVADLVHFLAHQPTVDPA